MTNLKDIKRVIDILGKYTDKITILRSRVVFLMCCVPASKDIDEADIEALNELKCYREVNKKTLHSQFYMLF